MKFIQAIGVFVNVFYLFGHSDPMKLILKWSGGDDNEKSRNFFHRLCPTIILSVLNLCMCGEYIFITQRFGYVNFARKNLLLLLLLTQIFLLLSVFYQTVFCSDLLRHIIHLFCSVELFFKHNLNFKISYKLFRRDFLKQISLMFYLFLQEIATHSLRETTSITSNTFKISGFLIRIEIGLSLISYSHIIFYTNLLTANLKHLNSVIVRDTCKYSKHSINVFAKQSNEKEILEMLKNYKVVHYRLWQATESINAYLGWTILVINMQAFIDTVYCLYWLVTTISRVEFTVALFGMF